MNSTPAAACMNQSPGFDSPVGQWMSPIASTVRPQDCLLHALQLLIESGQPSLYVTDDAGQLWGRLPDYEVLKACANGRGECDNVSQWMTRGIVTALPTQSIQELLPRFRECACAQVAIVESGRLLGEIRRSTLLKVLRRDSQPEFTVAESAVSRPNFLSTTLRPALPISL